MNWLERDVHKYLDNHLPRDFKSKVTSSEAKFLVRLITRFITENPKFTFEIKKENEEAESHDFLNDLKKI